MKFFLLISVVLCLSCQIIGQESNNPAKDSILESLKKLREKNLELQKQILGLQKQNLEMQKKILAIFQQNQAFVVEKDQFKKHKQKIENEVVKLEKRITKLRFNKIEIIEGVIQTDDPWPYVGHHTPKSVILSSMISCNDGWQPLNSYKNNTPLGFCYAYFHPLGHGNIHISQGSNKSSNLKGKKFRIVVASYD